MKTEGIKRHFERARGAYEREAVVQKTMAEELMQRLENQNVAPKKIVEIGCGTGRLTRMLAARYDGADIVAADPADVRQDWPRGVRFVQGDFMASRVTDGMNGVDLVASNAAFQWFENQAELIEKCREIMAGDGVLAFATFGVENCREIREMTGKTLAYRTMEAWKTLLREQGFETLEAWETRREMVFGDARAVLRHVVQTGVSLSEGPAVIKSPGDLRAFEHEYARRYAVRGGVRLTYHPLGIVARKRAAAG